MARKSLRGGVLAVLRIAVAVGAADHGAGAGVGRAAGEQVEQYGELANVRLGGRWRRRQATGWWSTS